MFYSCSQRTLEIYKWTLINDYIFMGHIHLNAYLKYTKKSIILMFESGEHGGEGRLDDGVIKYFTPFKIVYIIPRGGEPMSEYTIILHVLRS